MPEVELQINIKAAEGEVETYRSINFTPLPSRDKVERVGQVLRLTSCQTGFVLTGENGQQLEAIAGSPDWERISFFH